MTNSWGEGGLHWKHGHAEGPSTGSCQLAIIIGKN